MKDRKDAIGFVFSGGGLQGIAHIGAVTALYEIGIRPEYVSGTRNARGSKKILENSCRN